VGEKVCTGRIGRRNGRKASASVGQRQQTFE
jgi:hypothetical protein